jgi:hypothetical protein
MTDVKELKLVKLAFLFFVVFFFFIRTHARTSPACAQPSKVLSSLFFLQEHLEKDAMNRVMFLAPKVKLAEQQYIRFSKYFPKITYFRCGRMRSSPAPFSEVLSM